MAHRLDCGRGMTASGHGLPRHHRPGKVRSRFSEETFAGVSSRDCVAPIAVISSPRNAMEWFDAMPAVRQVVISSPSEVIYRGL